MSETMEALFKSYREDSKGAGSFNEFVDRAFAAKNAELAAVTAQRDALLLAAKAVVAASNSDAASGGEMWWAETVSPTVDALEAAIAAAEAGKDD